MRRVGLCGRNVSDMFCFFAVRAEDFQGHHTEKTKGMTVRKDLLLKKEDNTAGHGTEATTAQNMHQHTAAAESAKFQAVVLFDTRPALPYGRTQITKASAVFVSSSGERFVSRNGRNSAIPTKDDSSAVRFHTGTEDLLISNYATAVFSPPQAAFDTMLNGSSEPEVHPSTEVVKPLPWLHTLLGNSNQRNTDSVALTSADTGPRAPNLSASHPRVIDNLALPRTDNDDKRSESEDGKGISNLGRNEYPLRTTQSIFQNDTADDSEKNLCLTCLKDRRAHTEKSVAPTEPSSDASSDSFRTEGLASDPNQFTASLPSLYQQSAGEPEEVLKRKTDQNIKYSSFTMNPSPDTGTLTSDTQSFVEVSSVPQVDKKQLTHTSPRETFVTERLSSAAPVFYSLSKSLYSGRKPVKTGKKVSIREPQSKLMHLSENNTNAYQSLSTNFKKVFLQTRRLDLSGGSVRNVTISAEAPQSGKRGVFPEGSDHSAESHPTARIRLNEPHNSLLGLSGPTTSSVSVLKSQAAADPSYKTKEPEATFEPEDFTIRSVTTKRHLTDERDSQTFKTVNTIFKQPVVGASASANKAVAKEPQTSIFTTRDKTVAPAKLFPPELRQDFDDDTTVLTLTTLSGKSSSERLTLSLLLVTPSKITSEKTFDVSSDYHVTPIHQSFAKHNRESLIAHNLKVGDKDEQMLTAVAEGGNRETQTDGKQIKDIEEIIKLEEIEKLETNRELFRPDKTENRTQEEIINMGAEITQNKDREQESMEEHGAKREEEEGGGRKGETKINTDNSTSELSEEQREPLPNEGSESRREETSRTDDIKPNRNMTNVPLGPTPNSKEDNRDKAHRVTNLFCCFSLIKQSGSTEPEGIHLGENITQSHGMKNQPFSYEATINHAPLHPTLSSQRPKLSTMKSLLQKSHTQIKIHLSAQHGHVSLSAMESAQDKVAEVTFPATTKPQMVPKLTQLFGVDTSRFRDTLKPTFSPLSSAAKSAHPDMLSLTATGLAITTGQLRAQPHFTGHSLTPGISVHGHTFDTSALKVNSLLQATEEQVQYIMPAHVFESSVEDLLTPEIIEEVHISTTVNLTPLQQMYNDSLTRPPTVAALSSEAHVSTGQLQPNQGQSAPKISQSSSSHMTSGQPCSSKPSEQTAHSDALHAPVDDYKQGSVQTLMASMSPEAKTDQFTLSSTSPLLNLMLFGGDSLPGTSTLKGITRSAPEKGTLGDNSDAEYANSGSVHTVSLSGTADEMNQTEESDSVASAVKHSAAVAQQTAVIRDERNSLAFIAQMVGRSKHHANKTDEFTSLFMTQDERLAVKNPAEREDDDLLSVDGDNSGNNNKTVKTTFGDSHLSQMEGYNETSTTPTVFTMHTTHRTEEEVSEDIGPVMNEVTVPVLLNTDPTKTQTNDVTYRVISDMSHHAVTAAEKQHSPFTPQGIVGDIIIPVPHNFQSDLKVPAIPTQPISDQIMNVTSEFLMITTKSNDIAPLVKSASTRSPIVSTEAAESVLTTGESMQVVTEKPFQATHSEHAVQSSSNTDPLSPREPAAPPTTVTLTPAVRGKDTTETERVEQPECEMSARPIKHSPPDVTTTAPFTQPMQGTQADLLKTTHRAGRGHDRTLTMTERAENSPLKNVKTALTTKSALKVDPLLERTTVVYTEHREVQHKKHTLPEKTSISQGLLGPVTDSLPPTRTLPAEIVIKTSCGTIGCAKTGDTTTTTIGRREIDHTAAEKLYKMQAGDIRGDNFNAPRSPATKTDNDKCSTGCPLPGEAAPQATNLDYVVLSATASKSDHDHAPTDETVRKHAKSMTDETSTKTQGALVESGYVERGRTSEQARFAEKTTQSDKETSEVQEATATKVTFSERTADTTKAVAKAETEQTLLTGKKLKTQLNSGAAKPETFEAQNATRSARAVAKGESAVQESGRRLLELESESELLDLSHRRSSPHLYLSG